MCTTANHTKRRKNVSRRLDFQLFDLAGQGIPVDAQGIGGLRQVALALFDDFDDEAAIELAQGILVVDAFLDHLRDQLLEQPVHASVPSRREGGRVQFAPGQAPECIQVFSTGVFDDVRRQ